MTLFSKTKITANTVALFMKILNIMDHARLLVNNEAISAEHQGHFNSADIQKAANLLRAAANELEKLASEPSADHTAPPKP